MHRPLPVGTTAVGHRKKQYVLDREGRVRAVHVSEWGQSKRQTLTWENRLQELQESAVSALVPKKGDVTPDYWRYHQWRAGHRFFSAMLNNFATQSLLTAVGVGKRSSLPAAAALNWILKDGMGRLGRLSVTAKFGSSFDASLKRFRFGTSMLFSASSFLEYVTPLFPRHFLLLASLANVGKSVSLSTYVSTQPSINKSFSRSGKLADITAKAQAQQVIMDTAGLLACVALTFAVQKRPQARSMLPLAAFPVLAASDLACIYRELKSVHLRTLTLERADLLCTLWLQTGRVPSPREVSDLEPLLVPLNSLGPIPQLRLSPLEVALTQSGQLSGLHRGKRYVLGCQEQEWHLPWRERKKVLHLAVDTRATPSDVLQGVLEAALLRQELQKEEAVATSSEATSTCESGGGRAREATPSPNSCSRRGRAKEEGARRKKAAQLEKEAREAGWQTNDFMLSNLERCSYSWLDPAT